LILFSPLGLILPAKFNAETAWGEWSVEEIHEMVGYVPKGMAKLSGKWDAPMPDYARKGQEDADIGVLSTSYILSGALGVAIVAGVSILIGRALAKRERD